MAEKVEHGRSKLISNYGGIGSVIDTIDCSIIIESFDNWHYPSYFDIEHNQYIIIDDRLLNRLKARFPLIKQIVSIPTEDGFEVQPQANIFPKWFFCPRCKRFMHYNDWKNHWQLPEFLAVRSFMHVSYHDLSLDQTETWDVFRAEPLLLADIAA